MVRDSLREELEKLEKKIKDLLAHPDRYTERKYPWKREIKLEWFLDFLQELLDILRKIEQKLGEEPRRPIEKHQIIIPESPLPPTGIRYLDIFLRDEAYVGDPILIEVVSDDKPVTNAMVKIISLDTLEVVERGKTDDKGTVKFSAPAVDRPTVFLVDVEKEGYVYYWPKEDWRAEFEGTGVYPIANVTVYPLILGAPQKPFLLAGSPKFEIDAAFGWTAAFRLPSFGALIEKAKKKGYITDEDWWVGDGTISDHLKEKGQKDVWIWIGHTDDTDGDVTTAESITGWRPGAVLWGYTTITPEELCDYIKKSGSAPGIVFLGGCSSASLLQKLIDCCVKLAIGFTNTLPTATMATALIKFWEALLDGKTLDDATKEVNNFLKGLDGKVLNKQNARLGWKAKVWLKDPGSKKLDEIRDAEGP